MLQWHSFGNNDIGGNCAIVCLFAWLVLFAKVGHHESYYHVIIYTFLNLSGITKFVVHEDFKKQKAEVNIFSAYVTNLAVI